MDSSTKILTWLFVIVIDYPLMLWMSSGVFNVDWSDPWGVRLMVSVVVSLLATAGAAWALHHLGRNRRENKDDRRRLRWSAMSAGARASLAGVVLLVGLIGVVMWVRIHDEGVQGGLAGLAVLMATLVALVMVLAAALVFSTAFRDGSPQQDDYNHYSARVRAARSHQAELVERANRMTAELEMLRHRPVVVDVPVTTLSSESPAPTGAPAPMVPTAGIRADRREIPAVEDGAARPAVVRPARVPRSAVGRRRPLC